MKQLTLAPVLLVLVSFWSYSTVWSFSERRLTARAAFLMEAATGKVLYQRAADRILPPASTTKVITALVALENKKLDDHLTVTEVASQVTSLKLGLKPGQTMSVKDLLYSALLYSANDASVVLAEGIGGSVKGFAEMMTRRAQQIGAKNSQFKNPHGLTAPGHYSTARDLALIFNDAMKNEDFRTIVRTKRKRVDLVSAGHRKRVKNLPLRNKNRLLWNFQGAIGGKTGYTRAARRCFVGAATRGGVALVVSILGSRSMWRDAKTLLEYGFRRTLTDNASISPSKKHGRYMVQVGSFRDQRRAESFRRKISKVGVDAFVQKAFLANGPTAYRVRIGPYTKWIQAKKAARELERERGFRTVIFLSPPP